MAAVFANFVATVFLINLMIADIQAECCHATGRGYCADCSWVPLFNYCGKGKCNIFGCACQGGCKESCNPTTVYLTGRCVCNDRKRELSRPLTGADANDVFVGGDGFISLK
ncbi:uncharacterized protein LOC106157098 [Lingula anatina]|uniref:Uncharacterized protein LOC106157098 n=1 Tax=Lingula anatina TaxID=7574 RepID=A0A1S3HPS4_LINAN|nr:uncharacterized protein LOC106157098 [Lingula anatina]XP_013388060.1 uncharacterized protein LOC106157098 [Lingula anatina]|eukprot:XP_013388053.1 uncharacterized protein LOC106157098 [Lingula anatina]